MFSRFNKLFCFSMTRRLHCNPGNNFCTLSLKLLNFQIFHVTSLLQISNLNKEICINLLMWKLYFCKFENKKVWLPMLPKRRLQKIAFCSNFATLFCYTYYLTTLGIKSCIAEQLEFVKILQYYF